ncbi:hypothetical protein [Streptomyces abyssomicinicus]|uniref:hypothetical protein n=1 Tax=Streptomyces abyssomicinicus TaxID=574929 RepID=UPI00124FA6A2|nr:hypothetical protein [Streptomyces abyssomicinicus]
MRRGRLVAAVCTVLALGATNGCSPPLLPLVAVLELPTGGPAAVLRPCERDQDHSMTVELRDQGWDGWQARTRKAGSAVFRLFSPPDSWQVTRTGEQRLVPGGSYDLEFAVESSGGFVDHRGFLYSFSTADLASLRPGEVLTGQGTMTREEFLEQALDHC